jgi:GT2 family glycosyltransferase
MFKPELSIVIVNYNSGDYLSGTLKSIADNPPSASWEVLIIDNQSSDNSFVKAKESFSSDERFRFTDAEKNLGFAGGNNRLIYESFGDFILLLNPDTSVTRNSLDRLLQYLKSDDTVGVVGLMLIDGNNNSTVSYGWFPTIRGILSGAFLPKRYQSPRSGGLGIAPDSSVTEPLEVDYVSGACLMTKRKLFDEVGFLDDGFFAYFEETDWCFRLKSRGYKIVFLPDVKIVHFEGRSFTGIPYRKMEIFVKSAKRFFKKHFPKSLLVTYIAANVAASSLKIFYLVLTGLFSEKRRQKTAPALAHHRAFLRALTR